MFMLHSSKALFFQFCVGSGHHNSTYKTTSAKEYNPAFSIKKNAVLCCEIGVKDESQCQ